MSKKSLDVIRKIVGSYLDLINAPITYHPTYGATEDGARPNIEVNGRGYHYVVVERGQELDRITTNQLDELLFIIFDSITFSMASNFELRNRNSNQDSRRILFKNQEELLGIINKKWRTRKEKEHEIILKSNPFRDNRY